MRMLLLLLLINSGFIPDRENTEVIRYLQDQAESLGMTREDLRELTISSAHQEKKTGLTYYYVQQNFSGFPVEHALAVAIRNPAGKIQSINHRFVPLNASFFNLPSITAPGLILQKMKQHFASNRDAPADLRIQQLMWIRENDQWILTYDIRLDASDQHQRYWVMAKNGQIVRERNLVKECHFINEFSSQDILQSSDRSKMPEEMADESYLVYPWPVESPQHGQRSVVIRPADLQASPYGWHDIDGQEGPEYTDTRGNNVFAQNDQDGLDVSEDRPDGGSSLNFSFDLDLSLVPSTDATVTNLFYWNNLNHDLFYHYGFDEAAGNFQINNYQKGGLGLDQVYADAQDGSDLNNARFFVAEDGTPGRMQMYLWRPRLFDAIISLQSSDGMSIQIDAVESGFSNNNKLATAGLPQKAEIVLVNDRTGGTHLACLANPASNADSITGRIALIDRGNCFSLRR